MTSLCARSPLTEGGATVKYEESRTLEQAKRTAKYVGTASILALAFVGGTLHGRARFAELQAAREVVPGGEQLTLAHTSGYLSGAAEPNWDLPNLDHPRVDDFIRMFTTGQRNNFARYMSRSGLYVPMISAKLEERGMPQDLIYLAMIESGFNPTAYSKASASGLWQFIGETGRRYGLDINLAVDERNDPEKATDAALTYLQELHNRFGSWYLAAAAYNTGENRVARIMREETGSERGDESSYFLIRDRLPRETRDYVPLMIAAARIAKEPGKYGFGDVEIEEPLAFSVVEVPPASSLAAVAEASGTTVAEIQRLNPQLKLTRTRNDQASNIRVPAGAEERFAANWTTVSARHAAAARAAAARTPAPKAAPRAPAMRNYTVRRGDSLSAIAKRHGTSVEAIRRANNLRNNNIRAGAVLRIPARS
jgi:membrane-bound lytic murein transglycosylase D